MTTFLPFPAGRFSEDEWRAAYRFTLDEEDAAREAAWNVTITPDLAEWTSISEVDLAYLSLVSDELAQRVATFWRESVRADQADDAGITEAREKEWEELRVHLRRELDGRTT